MQVARNNLYHIIWLIVVIVGVSIGVYKCAEDNNRLQEVQKATEQNSKQTVDNGNKMEARLIGRNLKEAYPLLTEKLMDLMQPDSYWFSNEPDVKISLNGNDYSFGVNTALVIEDFRNYVIYNEYYDPQTQAPMAKLRYSEKWEMKCDSTFKTFYFTDNYPSSIKINNLGMDESLFRQFDLKMMEQFKKEKEEFEERQKATGYSGDTPIRNEIVKLNSTEFEYKNALTDKMENYQLVSLTPVEFEDFKKQIRF